MTDTDLRIIFDKLRQFEEELRKIESEIRILKKEVSLPNVYPNRSEYPATKVYDKLGQIPCYFENISPKDRMKPMSVSCPCPRCSPYSLSQGSLSDGGIAQVWYQGLTKLGDNMEE